MENKEKIILDLCGGTGAWSRPYKDAGYDVRVITLPEYDVCTYVPPENVYGILAAPPCTEFSIAKHFHVRGNYTHNFKAGLEVCSACCRIILTCKPKFWCIENPANGLLKKWLGNPDYVFSPWEFGHPYQKLTSLWGVFNHPVKTVKEKPIGLKKFSMLHSREIYPEFYGIFTRQERRAITPPGFAQAFDKEDGMRCVREKIHKRNKIRRFLQLWETERKAMMILYGFNCVALFVGYCALL